MLPAAVLITLSLLWLGWRAVQVWTLPLTVVLRHLQIEMPSAPRVTIDALTFDSVSLHWVPPDTPVKRHIILANGQEVGVSHKGETSVRISGLNAEYLYSIQIVAVNAQGFQMASLPTHVRTRPRPLDEPSQVTQEPHVQTFSTGAESVESSRKTRRRTDSLVKPLDSKTPVPKTTKTAGSERAVDDLSDRLEVLHKEHAELDLQMELLAANHAQEEASIQKRIEELRQKKKEEDEARSLKDQQHKHLDQQKREVESKRNQLQKVLKIQRDQLQKQTTDIASFRSSVQNSIDTVEHLKESLKTLKTETEDAVNEANRATAIATEELAEVESEIRYLLSRKAESEGELAKLTDTDRKPVPSAQEVDEDKHAEMSWREREESLMKQFEEAQLNLLRIQNNVYAMPDVVSRPPSLMESSSNHGNVMRRKVSKRGRPEDHGKPEASNRYSGIAFNPDAVPFVASAPMYASNDAQSHNRPTASAFGFPLHDQYSTSNSFTQSNDSSLPALRSNFQPGLAHGSSSIFSDEPTIVRSSSPFVRRGSAKSSQSGSNPASPAIMTKPALSSIFNTAPVVSARSSATNLPDRLNGTPLSDSEDNPPGHNADGSKWFWPVKKKTQTDPLLLDRKNTRSLPKSDVAPIGTRRNRSGSLREESNPARVSPGPVSNGYHDLDLSNVIGHPLSRETSMEKDAYSTTAAPLPRPSRGSAFGWNPQFPDAQRRLANPWRDSEHHGNASARPFDPFGDLPTDASAVATGKHDTLAVPSMYHTTIDASRLTALDRATSNGSRKSNKSKADSQESKEKMRRLGDTKFSSFVGRVFGKKDGEKDGEAEDSIGDDVATVEMTHE